MCAVYIYGCKTVREARYYVCGVYVCVYECERSSRLCVRCIYIYVCMNVREVRDYVCGVYICVYECERSERLCVYGCKIVPLFR